MGGLVRGGKPGTKNSTQKKEGNFPKGKEGPMSYSFFVYTRSSIHA
jgi:hypothetical protein